MRYVVTGATGRLGRLVVDQLVKRLGAHKVAALVRDPSRAQELGRLGVELRVSDYTRPDTLRGAFFQDDRVLLVSSNAMQGNFEQHRAVVAAATEARVAFLAYTSILGAPNARFGIADQHNATEHFIRQSGLAFTLLRNGWYNENYSDNLGFIMKLNAVVGSAASGRIASASRVDYAEAAAIVLTQEDNPNSVYELSGDHAWTMQELAEEISLQTHSTIRYSDLPVADYVVMMTGAGVPLEDAKAVADADAAIARGELAATPRELSALLGRPTTSIRQSVAAALAARQQQQQ